MKFSRRLDLLKPYVFVEIARIIARKRSEGIEVVSFGVGDPDMPTPNVVIDRLVNSARDPVNHRYPETDGLPRLREAIASWYNSRFGVSHLDPTSEVLPLIGAKEGVGHVAFCFLDAGDIALVPDPAYPVYGVGTMFAGADVYTMPLYESNGWLPVLEDIPVDIAKKSKVMWLNYPNNPTGAVADKGFYQKAIQFAKEYEIALLHDAAYSENVYEGYKALSIMELDGAKDVSMEFHSLSKLFNMTGWRFGMAVGNSEMVQGLFKIKSNLDSGIPQAIQEMAIEALSGSQIYIDQNNSVYQSRRDKLVRALNDIGLKVTSPQAALYLWAQVPDGYTSESFTARLLDDLAIAVTPGSSFGECGEGYIRLSLTTPDNMIDKGVERLLSWKNPSVSGG
ncbi:aminotransferase class I/II-fold pyridoxal phosphate-dependent enzyme [SAR202 cluster bacterium AC-409-J13_OGT_754m]|nr:aminotransferase class I/II-fold pyridoxal phosphate-dependent enzyme [SAR202 cluster bacterium AC-409-J13_OGT_754m]